MIYNKTIVKVGLLVLFVSFFTAIVSRFVENAFLTFTRYVFYASFGVFCWLAFKRIVDRLDEKKKLILNNLSKYLFLILLFLITIGSLNFEFIKFISEPLKSVQVFLIVITLVLGVITFYLNRGVIDDVEAEKTKEEREEEKRKKEFSFKFPKINRVWGLRTIVKWIYKEGWWYSFGVIGVYIIFAAIQVYKIYTTGIGTDEGNFLYTVKLIFQGNVIFLDLWVRESGSLLFLVPWFKIFEINIINLRWLIFLIHTIIFILFYLFLKCISKKKKTNLIILLVSIILLQFNADLDIFQGIFYQLGSLFSILILYLSYKYYSSKSNFSIIFLIGVLTGLAILSYKGLQTFLIITPFVILLKNRGIDKNHFSQTLTFFISTLIPILIYWLYYSLKTDFFHIYKVILEDVTFNLSILFLIFLISNIILLKKSIKRLLEKDHLIIFTNIIIFSVIIYELINAPEIFLFSSYSGVILSFPFIAISLQILNLYAINNYRRILTLVYVLINILILIFGFGSRGFFTTVSNHYQVIATSLLSIYSIYLIYYGFKLEKNNSFNEDNKWILILIFNIWFAISIVGGYLIPTRFQTILIFLPILFILMTYIKTKSKYILYFVLLVSIFFSISINVNLQNDYTFYTLNEFNQVTEYLKNNFSNDQVFSLDTAVLASINNQNALLFHSPFHLREEHDIYFYDGLKKRYGEYEISLTKSEALDLLESKKPQIIFGAWRSTLRIFDQEDWKYFLNENYELIKNFGRIQIYRLK